MLENISYVLTQISRLREIACSPTAVKNAYKLIIFIHELHDRFWFIKLYNRICVYRAYDYIIGRSFVVKFSHIFGKRDSKFVIRKEMFVVCDICMM